MRVCEKVQCKECPLRPLEGHHRLDAKNLAAFVLGNVDRGDLVVDFRPQITADGGSTASEPLVHFALSAIPGIGRKALNAGIKIAYMKASGACTS